MYKQPHFTGNGNHNKKELEAMCAGFKEFCWQEQLKIQDLEQKLASASEDRNRLDDANIQLNHVNSALEQKLAEAEKLTGKYKSAMKDMKELPITQECVRLTAKLSEALEVIRFYGDVDNWTDVSANICSSMTGGDDHGVLQPFKDRFCAGQRARRFLEKHGLEKV